jgi:glycerol kinase
MATVIFHFVDLHLPPLITNLDLTFECLSALRVICGLTAFTTKNHIIRAALETVCYQITDVIEAMKKDAGIHLTKLHVDGKMVQNNLLMQLQADISGIPICRFHLSKKLVSCFCFDLFLSFFVVVLVRSQTNDTTSLGCAIAAGRAEGIDLIDFSPQNRVYSVKVHHDTYLPTSTDEDRKARNKKWKMAVSRSYGWKTAVKSTSMTSKSHRSLYKISHQPFASQMLSKL